MSLEENQFGLLDEDGWIEEDTTSCRETIIEFLYQSSCPFVAIGTGLKAAELVENQCKEVVAIWPQFSYEIDEKNRQVILPVEDTGSPYLMSLIHAALGIIRGHRNNYLPPLFSKRALQMLLALGPHKAFHAGCILALARGYSFYDVALVNTTLPPPDKDDSIWVQKHFRGSFSLTCLVFSDPRQLLTDYHHVKLGDERILMKLPPFATELPMVRTNLRRATVSEVYRMRVEAQGPSLREIKLFGRAVNYGSAAFVFVLTVARLLQQDGKI